MSAKLILINVNDILSESRIVYRLKDQWLQMLSTEIKAFLIKWRCAKFRPFFKVFIGLKMSDWQSQLGKLVYSTDQGRIKDEPESPELVGEEYADGWVRIQRQTKGRKGKGVCIISGVVLPPDEFKKLAQTIKKKCGKGGAVKDGTIEVQGDDRDQIKTIMESLGYKCKLAGG